MMLKKIFIGFSGLTPLKKDELKVKNRNMNRKNRYKKLYSTIKET